MQSLLVRMKPDAELLLSGRMDEIRAHLEEMYRQSAFGALRVQVNLASRGFCDPGTDLDGMAARLRASLMTRAHSQVLSMLVRCVEEDEWPTVCGRSRSVCVPHVGYDLPDVERRPLRWTRGQPWSFDDKHDASLAQTLVYVADACAETWRGALFALHDSQHSNMVYVDLSKAPHVCSLVEPNGRAFLERTRAFDRLTLALRRANQSRPRLFNPHILLPGFEGVQRALGFNDSRRSYVGIGVCAAVTHWIVHLWVLHSQQASDDTFGAFIERTEAATRKSPGEHRLRLARFIHDVTSRLSARRHGESLAVRNLTRKFASDAKRVFESVRVPCPTDFRVTFSASMGEEIRVRASLDFAIDGMLADLTEVASPR